MVIKRINLKDDVHADERGWVINPLELVGITGKSPGNLHVASIQPGRIRGNHYHPDSVEWLMVCGGPALLFWRSHDETSLHEESITGMEPVLFEIPQNVIHAIKNESQSDIYLVAFSDVRQRETIRSTLI